MLYYPPKNKDHVSELGKAPPLLCKSHGGPTAAISASFNLSIQYWTRWVAFNRRPSPVDADDERRGGGETSRVEQQRAPRALSTVA